MINVKLNGKILKNNMNNKKTWLWCRTFKTWFVNRWLKDMKRYFVQIFTSIWSLSTSLLFIIFQFVYLWIDICLRPIADIFKLGIPYN